MHAVCRPGWQLNINFFKKKTRKENLQMTTLLRQGVESVCEGERQTEQVQLQKEAQVGWGPEAGQAALSKPGSGNHFYAPHPLRPTAMTTVFRPRLQAQCRREICYVEKGLPCCACSSLWSFLQDSAGPLLGVEMGPGPYLRHTHAAQRPSSLLG